MNEEQKVVTDTQEPTAPEAKPDGKKRRGFAALSKERVKEIAANGGRAAHAQGTAHRFSREEAQAAGRKGGLAKRKKS